MRAALRTLGGYPGRPLTALVLAVAAGGVWAATSHALSVRVTYVESF
jgi:hypothetical protein